MKNILFLVVAVVLLGLLAFRRYSNPTIAAGGIEFFEGTWQEALEKSKQEQKPIFLDIYASWCGPCKQLKRHTFSDTKVGEYFNQHFVNVALDGEHGEGPELARQLSVRGYPSLFVLDPSGRILTNSTGFKPPKDLLTFGETGLDKYRQASER